MFSAARQHATSPLVVAARVADPSDADPAPSVALAVAANDATAPRAAAARNSYDFDPTPISGLDINGFQLQAKHVYVRVLYDHVPPTFTTQPSRGRRPRPATYSRLRSFRYCRQRPSLSADLTASRRTVPLLRVATARIASPPDGSDAPADSTTALFDLLGTD